MVGIIQQNKGINSADVKSQMQIPPNLSNAFERIIVAGMKFMYSPETSKATLDQLKADGTPGQRVGRGVFYLMMLLFKESNQTMPPQLIVPAGIYLVTESSDFAKQVGIEMTDKDMGEAMQVFLSLIMNKFGGAVQGGQ